MKKPNWSSFARLTETSAMINSSLDADAILAQAMDEIINLTGAERGYILLRNKPTGRNRVPHLPRAGQRTRATAKMSATPLLHRSFPTAKPLLTDNASSDPRMKQSETVAKYHAALDHVRAADLQGLGHRRDLCR